MVIFKRLWNSRRNIIGHGSYSHAITPVALCLVQHLVRLAHKGPVILDILALKPGRTETCSDTDTLPYKRECQRGELFAETVYGQLDVFWPHVRDHQQEFISADAPT